MGVRIRLARHGAKKKPFYRIVVADGESPRDGKFLEVVGTYNPLVDPAEIMLKGIPSTLMLFDAHANKNHDIMEKTIEINQTVLPLTEKLSVIT